ncbi:unannotated protein [freshwater metagenome]|uniref:Unannotated protein n=1 Tax=freshwater metagenome TaxID=449393 RepID=A0A6J7AAD8_9ZZZZ
MTGEGPGDDAGAATDIEDVADRGPADRARKALHHIADQGQHDRPVEFQRVGHGFPVEIWATVVIVVVTVLMLGMVLGRAVCSRRVVGAHGATVARRGTLDRLPTVTGAPLTDYRR